MTGHRIVDIKAQIEDFPALPATVSKVITVTSNSDSNAEDLIQAVLPDQSMCSAILKVANSAFFGIPREVGTIERAVVVLGFEEIRNIVIGKAVFASFPKMDSKCRMTVRLFWEHAFTCGLAAKLIGERLALSPSELFIAGLIHDIGKLAMFIAFPREYPILGKLNRPEDYCDTTAEERRSFAASHDQVGRQLAEKWLLPQQLVTAIGYHHFPWEAPSFQHYPLIVQVADLLALMYGSADILKVDDVIKIFNDFFPETAASWEKNHLPWNLDEIGAWFSQLKQVREKDESILSIFATP